MAALVVALAVMAILSSVAMPAWQKLVQREREEELIFRGEQYARAVVLFQRRYGGGLPPNVDVLVEQRFLRRKYRDPLALEGEFELLYQGTLAQQPGEVAGGPATRPPGQASPATPGASPGVGGTLGPRGGLVGVMSKRKGQAIKTYQGRNRYEEWQFVYTNIQPKLPLPPGVKPGAPGPATPQPRPGAQPSSRPGTRSTGPAGPARAPTFPQ